MQELCKSQKPQKAKSKKIKIKNKKPVKYKWMNEHYKLYRKASSKDMQTRDYLHHQQQEIICS